ncbi:MAG TPA: L-lactate permease [Verrucomicrobiae bacterium]|jgi:lactate permease|nr:L-lactate permease [Verrucomicrobiae bacterium]
MEWLQNYNPLGNVWLSTTLAAVPVVILLALIAIFEVRIHRAALIGLASALGVALLAYRMPPGAALATAIYGAAYGLFPIGWIILNLIFLYHLTVKKGLFSVLRSSLAGLAPDPRIQVILIAFSFGAFFEGAAGFGTPVAVTAAILIQLGFKPLLASGLSLIANTAPVAFGALGTPIIALNKVTGLGEQTLGAMVGRQLPFFSVIIPFWVVCAFAGFRGMLGVWPAAFVAGLSFAIPQFLVSNYHGPWLVDIIASLCSIIALLLLLRVWRPKDIWKHDQTETPKPATEGDRATSGLVVQAWVPWVLLTLLVFLWGLPKFKTFLDSVSIFKFEVPHLHKLVFRMPPVVPKQTPEEAVYALAWLSATGTGILVSTIIAGLVMRFSPRELLRAYGETIYRVRFSLVTIAAMLSLGYVTKYSGTDATLGLALAKTGKLYPFFGTLLGWLGVALTGSDTASNVLFGSLQRITAEQTGINPVLMCAANSSGGVMGKMVDAQSIVVASTATGYYGREGEILRFVFLHSLVLAALVGVLVLLQCYVPPFTKMAIPFGSP